MRENRHERRAPHIFRVCKRLNILPFPKPPAPPDARLQSEARDWLVLLTSGTANAADARALRQWCAQSPEHALAFEQSKALWQSLKPAAERLQQQAQPRRFGRRAFLGGAIAASLGALLLQTSLPGGVAGLGADYSTQVGEQRGIDLAGGDRIELNTQTRLNHRTAPDGGQGLELLSGEVEVLACNTAPLKVRAGGGWVSAAQARVNVRHTEQSVCVTCIEGTVLLDVQGRSLRLHAGRQLTYSSQEIGLPQSVDPGAISAWRQRVLVFEDAALATVIDEINRYRPGMLLLLNRDLGQRRVQARFSLDQLAGVALLIRDAYGVKITQLPGGVVLLG